ncbi:hypothetical protein RZS08_56385, partial [Arthrospira platensis SPKY1]|nr:hypothetical protein [Arthrospira platensis SPKY1]
FIFDAINSEGNPHQALAIYTYPVNISTDFVSSYSDPQFWPITSDYPYDLTIETTEFIESQTIFAWSNITIIGDLTTQPGVKVEIVAPNIQVLDESFIGSDIWLRDGYVPFASCEPLG